MTIDEKTRNIFRDVLMSGTLDLEHDSMHDDVRRFFNSFVENPTVHVVSLGLELDDDGILVHGLMSYADFVEGVWYGWTYILGLENVPDEHIKAIIPYFHIQIPLDDELAKEFKMRVEMELL